MRSPVPSAARSSWNNCPARRDPIPGAPLREARVTLDLSGSPDATEVALLLAAILAREDVVTWTVVYRFHGTITRCDAAPVTQNGQTTVSFDMQLHTASTPEG